MSNHNMESIKALLNQHQSLFVTGTDTEVGKTYVTKLIVDTLYKQGYPVFPFKPVSAGTMKIEMLGNEYNNQYVNEDAYELWQACHHKYSIEQINPIVFQQAIAPHIAAEYENKPLSIEVLNEVFTASQKHTQHLPRIVEGAGGWLLPLNAKELMSQWVSAEKIPVVLVVGVKLGCLNHALLTAQAIQHSGCELVGWVANFLQGETDVARKNLDYLKQALTVPCLFEVSKGA